MYEFEEEQKHFRGAQVSMILCLIFAILGSLMGCLGDANVSVAPSKPCTVVDSDAGAVVKCPDGTEQFIADGQAGQSTNGTNGLDGKDGANGADGAAGAAGADGRDGVDGVNGVDGRDGQDGATGPAGAPGTNGTSCSAGTFENGIVMTCGTTETYYTLPTDDTTSEVTKAFKNSIPYNILLTGNNVALTSSFRLDGLRGSIGSGANGRITLNINGKSYCFQSQVGTKTFRYIGTTVSTLCNSPAIIEEYLLPVSVNIKTLYVALEHRSDTPSRWLMDRNIKIEVETNGILVLE